MFQALMRGIGQTKIPLLIVFSTVGLNFILDPLFIFGWGPVPPQGVRGAALATLATQGLAALVGFLILLRGRHGIHVAWHNFRPDFSYIKKSFIMGFPVSIELSTRSVGPMALAFMATGFGTITMAAYGVGSNILQFITIPAMGLSMAVSTLVGQNMGAGNIQRAAHATFLGALWGFITLSFVGVIAFIFAEYLVAFFIPGDEAVITQGAQFLRIMCLAWGGISIQLCLIATFRASGKMIYAMGVAVFSQLVLQLPLAYFLAKHTPLQEEGLWWSFPIATVVAVVISLAWFKKGGWKKGRLTGKEREVVQVTEETIIEDGIR
jgi:putative MATE family efflux protein